MWSGREERGNIAREGNIFSHVCPQEGNHVVVFVHTYLLGDLTPPTHMGTSPPTEPVPTYVAYLSIRWSVVGIQLKRLLA